MLDKLLVAFLDRLDLMSSGTEVPHCEWRDSPLLSVYENCGANRGSLDHKAAILGFQVLVEKDAGKRGDGNQKENSKPEHERPHADLGFATGVLGLQPFLVYLLCAASGKLQRSAVYRAKLKMFGVGITTLQTFFHEREQIAYRTLRENETG